MSSAPKIVIVGASGAVGKATISHLVKRTDPATIYVVTRNPDSPAAEEFKRLGVQVAAGDLSSPDSLAAPFAGATSVLIILPAVEVRN
jgi:NAD(P)H dehydrogenase (quinone)